MKRIKPNPVVPGTFESHNSGTTTLGGTEDSSYLNNTGWIDTYNGATLTVTGDGTLNNGDDSYLAVYGGDSDGTIIIEEGGHFESAGTIALYGGTLFQNNNTVQLDSSADLQIADDATFSNFGYLYANAATIEIFGGGYLNTTGYMEVYNSSTLTVSADEYDDADAVLDNSGWLGIYNGSTMTVTGNADAEVTGRLNNSEYLDVYDGGTLTVGDSGDVTNAEGATTYIYGGDGYGTLTVNAGGSLESDGDLEIYEEGNLTINGFLLNDTDGTITQTGGELNVSSSGELDSAGTFDVSDGGLTINGCLLNDGSGTIVQTGGVIDVADIGMLDDAGTVTISGGEFDNEGLISLANSDLAVIDAINNYGSNTGRVDFLADVDLSGVTLTGGTYQIFGTATNDSGLIIDDATLKNEGILHWNDSDWSAFDNVVNDGYLVTDDFIENHWHDDGYLSTFDSDIEAGGEGYGSDGDPFEVHLSLDGDVDLASWYQPTVTNSFSITYDAGAETVTYISGGQIMTEDNVTWGDIASDTLFLTAGTDGVNGTNNGAKLSDLVFTPAGESPINLRDIAAAGYTSDATSDTLQVSGLNLMSGFTLEGNITMAYDVAVTHPHVWVSMKAGTIPALPVATGTTYSIDPEDQTIDDTIHLKAPSGSSSYGSVKITVTNNSNPTIPDTTAELEVDATTRPVGVYVEFFPADPSGKREVKASQVIDNDHMTKGWCNIRVHVKGDPVAWANIRVCIG